MTLRDPEVLEVLRDEPELLALADAFADTQASPSPRRIRRIAPRFALVAAVVAAIVLVVLFAPGGDKNPVLGRALAAIGNGRVLHLVLEMQSNEELVNLTTGRRMPVTVRLERWSDRDSGREHDVVRIGDTTEDMLLPDDLKGYGGSTGVTDPAFDALWKGYRKALADGDATLERSDVLDGRPVYWLRFPPFQEGLPGTEVAIDHDTYKPVLVRSHPAPGIEVESRVLKAETIPLDASDFKRVGEKFFGDAIPAGSVPSRSSDADDALKPPWLTAGKHVAGLELFGWGVTVLPLPGRPIKEAEFDYGDNYVGPRSLTIEEQEQPEVPGMWRHIPAGFISIQRGESSDENQKSYPSWTGALVVNGIYVRIETGAGEQALLDVAHALHPAP
jgi:hypothetical protein